MVTYDITAYKGQATVSVTINFHLYNLTNDNCNNFIGVKCTIDGIPYESDNNIINVNLLPGSHTLSSVQQKTTLSDGAYKIKMNNCSANDDGAALSLTFTV